MDEGVSIEGIRAAPTCTEPGCTGVVTYAKGGKCRPHTPVVTALAQMGMAVLKRPCVRVTCPDKECGHVVVILDDEASVRRVAERQEVRGYCPKCGLGHNVMQQLLVQANAGALNRQQRRAQVAKAGRT